MHFDDITQFEPRPNGVEVDKDHVITCFLLKFENLTIPVCIVNVILVGIFGSDFGELVETILTLRLIII